MKFGEEKPEVAAPEPEAPAEAAPVDEFTFDEIVQCAKDAGEFRAEVDKRRASIKAVGVDLPEVKVARMVAAEWNITLTRANAVEPATPAGIDPISKAIAEPLLMAIDRLGKRIEDIAIQNGALASQIEGVASQITAIALATGTAPEAKDEVAVKGKKAKCVDCGKSRVVDENGRCSECAAKAGAEAQ